MDIRNCWDCPIPFRDVLLIYGVFLALIVCAAAMMAARRQLYRGLGWMAIVVLFFMAAMYTIVIPRWGIGSAELPLEIWPRRTSWLILGVLDAGLGVVAIAIFQWRAHSASAMK